MSERKISGERRMWGRRMVLGGHALKQSSMNVQFVQRNPTTLYNYNVLI